MKQQIFYVEDDKNMSFLLKSCLEEENFDVDHFDNGLVALQNFKSKAYDICLLDVMLPGMDGFSIAKKIREINSLIPIILITARSAKTDKQMGFELLIDDYITKPFDEDELLWKINALLRRTNDIGGETAKATLHQLGEYLFDYQNLNLIHPSQTKRLTPKESELLLLLVMHMGEIVKKDDILKKIWGSDDYFNGRSMDVFINRLRKYLALDPSLIIETIPKVGIALKFG